ncbi:DUF1275 family protein [Nonomuraea wenchangensis]|uniref:Uncharacterized protein n=1 Tax=Nonomuraea wenchangensis TaxID=568860 RepID=A0A1I0KI72_9ACTN|nr:DUF1275 family protein [Nonomuraea wenchangensis]SEU24410.1 Protein of unknown function [Nonomuraea wenchangensis]
MVGVTAVLVTFYGLERAVMRNLALVLLAFSMGWQYALVLRLKVADVTTTVVTTTLTRCAPLWAAGLVLTMCSLMTYLALRRSDAQEWR